MLNAISRYHTDGTFLTSLEPEGRETSRNKDRAELRSEQVAPVIILKFLSLDSR